MNEPRLDQILQLDGEVALVTGGGNGIGRGIVDRLVEAGAEVHVVDIAGRPADDTRPQVTWHQADVRDREAAQRICASAEGLSILVNNAGVYELAESATLDDDLWNRTFDVNLKATFGYAQAASSVMRDSGTRGSIVNLSSSTALKVTPYLAHYGTSKAAVIALTRSLAVEYGPHGIRVNAIAPAGIPTARARQVGADARALGSPNLGNRPRPLGDVGRADDIAFAVLYLVSAMGRYVTGTLLVVDGGVTLV